MPLPLHSICPKCGFIVWEPLVSQLDKQGVIERHWTCHKCNAEWITEGDRAAPQDPSPSQ
jgi:hypothetical protein